MTYGPDISFSASWRSSQRNCARRRAASMPINRFCDLPIILEETVGDEVENESIIWNGEPAQLFVRRSSTEPHPSAQQGKESGVVLSITQPESREASHWDFSRNQSESSSGDNTSEGPASEIDTDGGYP